MFSSYVGAKDMKKYFKGIKMLKMSMKYKSPELSIRALKTILFIVKFQEKAFEPFLQSVELAFSDPELLQLDQLAKAQIKPHIE